MASPTYVTGKYRTIVNQCNTGNGNRYVKLWILICSSIGPFSGKVRPSRENEWAVIISGNYCEIKYCYKSSRGNELLKFSAIRIWYERRYLFTPWGYYPGQVLPCAALRPLISSLPCLAPPWSWWWCHSLSSWTAAECCSQHYHKRKRRIRCGSLSTSSSSGIIRSYEKIP